ncbi:MAG: DUF2764 family protein [Bradymonadales bacterium]|nr:DUF2764 family protein [Bradymonadales bacterium]
MKYYRLMSIMLKLPEVPDVPPIELKAAVDQIMEAVDEADRRGVVALLEFLDCRNLEARLQGVEVFDDRAVFSRAALEERVDLPAYMTDFLELYESGAIAESYPFDALWRAYFGHLLRVAEEARSSFLQEWAGFEITLRDALVLLRAEDLGEKGEPRLSGVLTEEGESHLTLLSAYAEASNPLEGERVLDRGRLKKIEAISGIDPFSADAVLAYLAALLILDRWDLEQAADMAEMLEVFG